jgi:hypothetical protein
VLAAKLACGVILVFIGYRRRASLRRADQVAAGQNPAQPKAPKQPK